MKPGPWNLVPEEADLTAEIEDSAEAEKIVGRWYQKKSPRGDFFITNLGKTQASVAGYVVPLLYPLLSYLNDELMKNQAFGRI